MTLIAASSGLTAEWFLTRASGIVALILLTATVALGVANVRRLRTERLPRFVIDGVHRNVALLSVVFLLIHISTSVLDGFVPISWADAVVPFGGSYRPFWLGLGALSFDLMLAVVITSLARRRLGYGAWRATHWVAYASWPIALIHGLGIGTDAGSTWSLLVTLICLITVGAAVAARLAGRDAHRDLGLPERPPGQPRLPERPSDQPRLPERPSDQPRLPERPPGQPRRPERPPGWRRKTPGLTVEGRR